MLRGVAEGVGHTAAEGKDKTMRIIIRNLVPTVMLAVASCEPAVVPAPLDEDGHAPADGKAMREVSKVIDSRVSVTTAEDGTVTITKVIGNSGYIRFSRDGREERIAMDGLVDYFIQKSPEFRALWDKILADPAFRRSILADDRQARETIRTFVENHRRQQEGSR